jgi:hypothetical protein
VSPVSQGFGGSLIKSVLSMADSAIDHAESERARHVAQQQMMTMRIEADLSASQQTMRDLFIGQVYDEMLHAGTARYGLPSELPEVRPQVPFSHFLCSCSLSLRRRKANKLTPSCHLCSLIS